MQTLQTVTITAGQSVTVSAGSRLTVGAVIIYNESNTLLRVTWGGSSKWLPAWVGDIFTMNQDPGFTGAFTIQSSSISSSGSAPSSLVAMHVLGPGEAIPGVYPVALVRQTNIGNGTIPVTNAPAVINDGNVAGTTVVEATQSGQGSSSLKMLNDGTTLIAPVSNGSLLDALTITPGGATTPATGSLGDSANPGNWALHGVADQASSVSASGVSGTLPASQVGTGYPVADLGAGTLPSGVSVPAASVAAGTLPSGVDLTTINSDGGKITSDGNGALTTSGNITSHDNIAAQGLSWGAGENGNFSFLTYDTYEHVNYYWPPQGGTASITGHLFPIWSGTAQVNIFSIGGQFYGALAWVDSSGNITANSFSANGNTIPRLQSNGGGSAGYVIWVGTTDPGSNASEGDIWVEG